MTIDQIYDAIQDIGRYTESGYLANDEFNRAVNLAQVNLLEYYTRDFEIVHLYMDSLFPFITTSLLSGAAGVFDIPADFRNDIRQGQYVETVNDPDCEDEPSEVVYSVRYIKAGSVNLIRGSAIRGADTAKRRYRYYYEDGKVKLLPEGLPGGFRLKYVRTPATIARAVTLDAVNKVENYDAGSSVHPEWLDKDLDNMVDLTLLFLGIEVRESDLVQWVAQKNQIVKPEMNN